MAYRPGQNIADMNFGSISIIIPNMNQIHQMVYKIRAFKNLNVNVDADANANADSDADADAGGSALALLDFVQGS